MEDFNKKRRLLNDLMSKNDNFFSLFGQLDGSVYSNDAIPKKYKELTGISISIFSRCEECVFYHLQEAIKVKASKEEIIEAIKIGVIGGGSITYPTARVAFETLKRLEII